jgi:ABC-type transport system substrate-binding protein
MRRPSRSVRSVLILVALAGSACPSTSERGVLPEEAEPPAGTLRLGYPEEPPTLNPVTDPSPASSDLLRAVLPSFFLVTPDLEYRPYLLDGEPQVRRAGGAMVIRFRIREEARWSDGRPVTVQDVAFTRNVMIDSVRPDGFDHLVAVEAESPKVGRLVLDPPLASWRELFSAGRFVLPAHAADAPDAAAGWDRGPPVSAGPYRLEGWTRGRSVSLIADPMFWGPPPGIRRVEVAFVPDPTTAIQLLGRGGLDAVAPMLGVSWGRRLDAIPGVSVSEAVGPHVVHLVIGAEAVPLVTARRGMADAIDRPRLAEALLRDEAVAADSVLVPQQSGFLPAWARYRGPVSSVAVGQELDLVYPRGELIDLVARYLQAELDRAGVDVDLVGLEADVFHGIFVPQRRFDLAIWPARTGPSPQLGPWVDVEGAAPPLTGLRDRALARLAAEAAGGGPGVLEAAQARLAELAPVLPLFQPEVTMAWRDGVRGIHANPTADGPLWNVAEWRLPG